MLTKKQISVISDYLKDIEDACADTYYWDDGMWNYEELYKLIDLLRESTDAIEDYLN